MKRILYAAVVIIVLALVAYFFLTRSAIAPVQETGQAPTPQAVTVSTSTLAEEGTDYSVHAEYPQFGISAIDEQIRSAVAAGADELKKQAATDTPVSHGFRKYEFIGTFSDVYTGPEFISVREVVAQDTGGAHPLPVMLGLSFNRATGKMLTLDDALALTGLTLAQVAEQSKAQLSAKLGSDIIAPEGFEANPDNYSAFVVHENNVIFIFQPYQVAPYSAGAPETVFARQK
ncbi:DUF3298 and DUF4163 domain-containing protein [Candidatus Kaiserbacteria bacterium]|nr:DUF3298 and DUF4163 domain-containing protein [Candidatus Kaiserbacteria bacterium]